MPGSILGNAVRRVEDPDLLRGRGTYVGNIHPESTLHVAFVRSPFAHGRLTGVDVSEAVSAPGVVAVYVDGDLELPDLKPMFVVNERCPRPALARDKVRFSGDIVAAVVAESPTAAADGAELVVADIDPLPAVADMEAALAEDAPLQFEELGTNLGNGFRAADGAAALSDAEVVVRVRIENQRIGVVPIEGDAILAVPDADRFTVWVSSQMPHRFHEQAAELLGIDKDAIRVVAPHVGGAFGAKGSMAPEHAIVLGAARQLGRPVAWTQTRSDNMVAMHHGRGQVQYAEMGFTRDGQITGARMRVVADCGAYAGWGGILAMGPTRSMAQGVYRIPKIAYEVALAITNTTPTGAFRGAGRPEAAALLERVMDLAAVELEIDPAELRRRNFLQPEEFPLRTVMGAKYDCGEYERALDEALRLARYGERRAEQAARRERGDTVQLGIGLSVYVEVTAGAGSSEVGLVEVHDDGTATVKAGTSAHGQGHATSFSMLVADRLGIPMESIRYVQSDTSEVPRGGGTGGSRSLQLGGSAVIGAADIVLERAKRIAADQLEAAEADIVVLDGQGLGVAGVPTSAVSWAALASAASAEGEPLAAVYDFNQEAATYPFGAHVSVVEVDTETGKVTPVEHIAVDDCGRILNPLLVEGQQHGGIAQGMAQALWEQIVYDSDGNPTTTTLADYGIPSAAEFPPIVAATTETPTPRNPLGAKGIGESGTIGALPSVHNAVIDAVAHLGVRHIDMPCTPSRVWAAIDAAQRGEPVDPWREPPGIFESLPELPARRG